MLKPAVNEYKCRSGQEELVSKAQDFGLHFGLKVEAAMRTEWLKRPHSELNPVGTFSSALFHRQVAVPWSSFLPLQPTTPKQEGAGKVLG